MSLSADTVSVGEIFQLRVGVPVPPGSIVYFPDTLPATIYVESAAPVRVDAEASSEGGALLVLTYEMMAFGSGELPVPGLDVLTVSRGDRVGVLELPGGSATGAWDEAPAPGGSRLTRIPREGVWVEPVFTVQELAEGVEPMPANDVAGGSWSWPPVALMAICGSLMVATLVSTMRGYLEGSGPTTRALPPTPTELRERALAELDALLERRWHAEGRLLDFYTSGSDIVRRYIVEVEGSWPTSLTSTELMRSLRARLGATVAGALPEELSVAEVVKFGRLRPDPASAERHLQALRGWLDTSGSELW